MTLVGEPSSVDTSASACEPPSDLSVEDLEMLKELEESIRVNGMDGQDPSGQPQGSVFCVSCRRCVLCRMCVVCRWI